MTYSVEDISSPQPQTQYTFEPQEDITPYEIALVLPVLIAIGSQRDRDIYQIARKLRVPAFLNPMVEELPEKVRRHFKV